MQGGGKNRIFKEVGEQKQKKRKKFIKILFYLPKKLTSKLSRAKRKKFFFDYFTNFWVGPHLNEKFHQIDLREKDFLTISLTSEWASI